MRLCFGRWRWRALITGQSILHPGAAYGETYRREIAMMFAGNALPGFGRPTATLCPFSFRLLLRMLANPYHAFVMTFHAVYPVACLGEDELVNAILADLAFEAVGVIGIIASHDRFVKDGFLANVAGVGAVCTYGRSVGKKK